LLRHNYQLFVVNLSGPSPLLKYMSHLRERFGSIKGGNVPADEFFFAVSKGFAGCRIDVQDVATRRDHVAVLWPAFKELPESFFAGTEELFQCLRTCPDFK
jgi:hypothetical protein